MLSEDIYCDKTRDNIFSTLAQIKDERTMMGSDGKDYNVKEILTKHATNINYSVYLAKVLKAANKQFKIQNGK